jgi:hypothetical protein
MLYALGNIMKVAPANLHPVISGSGQAMTSQDGVDLIAIIVTMFLVDCAWHEPRVEHSGRTALFLTDR